MSLKRGKSLNTRYSYKFKLYVSKYLPEYLAIQVDMRSTLKGEITQNTSIWTMQYEYMNILKCFCNGNLTSHPSEAKHNDMTRRNTQSRSKHS